MAKKILILRGGTMKGAFIVGALAYFYKKFGPDYFDEIYSNSVGIFEQVFYAAKQPFVMENTWRNYVDGSKLINFLNPFRQKPILDLDYLVNLFQSDLSRLDVASMVASKTKLYCVATDYLTREPHFFALKKGNVFKIMKATCAVPFLYNKAVEIDGKRYVDGSLSIKKAYPLILKNIEIGQDEAMVIINKKGIIKGNSPRVKILEPSRMPLRYSLDTDRDRLIETIERGRADAENFLKMS